MKIRAGLIAVLVSAGLSAPVFAQNEAFEVTLEVLDDVSEIDAVVLRLENEDRRNVEDREQRQEEREREFAADERERREADLVRRDFEREADERRESDLEERDIERDFERLQDERERDERERDRDVDESD
jgi:hypothetical protein